MMPSVDEMSPLKADVGSLVSHDSYVGALVARYDAGLGLNICASASPETLELSAKGHFALKFHFE